MEVVGHLRERSFSLRDVETYQAMLEKLYAKLE